jgi:alkylhydroperoxidase/carboxymuconolactone decarboxylase family protein YurZ
MWREAGLFNMKRGQEAMAMAEEDGKYHRRSGEQAMLEWAISAFWKAANAFQMVESDINHRWAVAAMQQAEGQLELAKNREDFEPPRRGGGSLTFSRPFEGEQEVDRELVRLATLACSGSAESFDFFLKKAAESLGTSPDDILEALAHPKEDLLAQLERKFFSFAKRFLNADLFAAIDPLEAGFYEKEPDPGIATLKGVGIFGALQIKLGNDNPSILNRLHALALKYKQ